MTEGSTGQLWVGASGTSHPYILASRTARPSRADWCISFLGMQPTFTHVPPSPHFVPDQHQSINQSINQSKSLTKSCQTATEHIHVNYTNKKQ